ncbi:MAG TPA: ABC transporter permease, partial [bacterium]|nr:ABC transporter permease [bacterium]
MGVAGGVLLGVLMGASQKLADYVDPWVSAAYTAPLVALTPLLIIWFGIGLWSKAIIICLVVIFPVTIGTIAGIRSTDRSLLEVAVSFGATRRDVLRKVMVPWALSFILSGARIGVGRGVIGIFVAELFGGASKGIGLMIVQAAQVFDTPLLFVGIIVLACFGIIVTGGLRLLERRLAPWRPQSVV